MIHACTNNFRLTSGEVFNYCINWSKASFDISTAEIQAQNNVLHISLWDRKRTQWATWGLIRTKRDSFWVGRLKWSHCWSQMVSFWVALRKLPPPPPLGLSWSHFEWSEIVGSQIDLLGLNWSHFEWPTGKLRPKGLKWPHSEWCGFLVAKAVSVGLNWSHFELHSLSSTHTMLTSSHSEGLFPNRGTLHSLWMRYACYPMWASINLTGCPMFGHLYAEGENVVVTYLLQNYLPNNDYPNVFNVVV